MLDTDTKRRIDTARNILVGKVPDPKSQVEQITIALIYWDAFDTNYHNNRQTKVPPFSRIPAFSGGKKRV